MVRIRLGTSFEHLRLLLEKVVRPGGLELPTFWFVARRSIQLSYGRTVDKYYHRLAPRIQPPRDFIFCNRAASKTIRPSAGSKQG
jgi:hypothetical protein